MKTQRNILIAFILNLSFSIFELVGGILTGSVAVASDAIHDAGDAICIGVSYYLEKKSKKQPDEKYNYGYSRFSVVGGFITTLILLIGSILMIINAVSKLVTPTEINYDGMIIFAVAGVCINFCAALFTRHGDNLNQKAVNLHMLEDVLGWVVILIGAIIMRFTDFTIIDPIMSIGVSAFIIINALGNLKEAFNIFLDKAPTDVDAEAIKKEISLIDGIVEAHHIHIRSIDGQHHYATMHVVTDTAPHDIKDKIREMLKKHGIVHVTIETEATSEHCHNKECKVDFDTTSDHHHHHHHH